MSNNKNKEQVIVIVSIKRKQPSSLDPDKQDEYETDEHESSEEDQDESPDEDNGDKSNIYKRSLEAILYVNEELKKKNVRLQEKIAQLRNS